MAESSNEEKHRLSMQEWAKTFAGLIEHIKLQKIMPIMLDDANPGFPAPPTLLEIVEKIKQTNPEIIQNYEHPAQNFQVENFLGFVQCIGIKPPLDPVNRGEDHKNGFSPQNVVFGSGATNIYKQAVDLLLNPNDVMLVPTPTYGLFARKAYFRGARVESVALRREHQFLLDPGNLDGKLSALERAGTPAKLFLHINPNNPLGTVEGWDRVQEIAKVLAKRNVFVIDDLAYLGLEYGCKAAPLSAFPLMTEKTITLFSGSKAYGIAGERVGVAFAPATLARAINMWMQESMESPSTTSKTLATTLFTDDLRDRPLWDRYLRSNADELRSRRDMVHGLVNGYQSLAPAIQSSVLKKVQLAANELENPEAAYGLLHNGIKGVTTLNTPTAGFFQVLDFSGYKGAMYENEPIIASAKIATAIARQSGVCILPGELMHYEGKELVGRISYSPPVAQIIEGLVRMDSALATLR